MEHRIRNGELCITLPERITADQYTAIRSSLLELIEQKSFEALSLDARNTRYISSSGLRIVLELLKAHPGLSVINVSLDVYEVFAMTGITELMKVTKAKRQVSVEGCPLIGSGKNGCVYRYDKDTIIKVYTRSDVREKDIEREHLLARKAFVLGVPTALTLDIVSVGEHFGAMYEMVDADTILGLIEKDPAKTDQYLLQFAAGMKLINSIHTDRDSLLPDKKQEFVRWAEDTRDFYTAAEYARLCHLIDAIPEADTLVHGDYHPGNVMLQGGELILIDMDTLGFGSPLIELSNLFFTLLGVLTVMGEDHLYEMDEQERLHWWKTVTDFIFAEADEAEKARSITLAEAICLCRAVRFGLRHNADAGRLQAARAGLFARLDRCGL